MEVGAFGEVSSALTRWYMSALAESRVLTCQSQETRKPLTSGWQSVILGQYHETFIVRNSH